MAFKRRNLVYETNPCTVTRSLIGYAIPMKHKNNSSNVLSFCYFFFLLEIVKLLILISPGAGSGPQISALRGLSRDRPPHTHSGG